MSSSSSSASSSSPEVTVKIDDMIGPTNDISCSEHSFTIRGLTVRAWHYFKPENKGKGPCVFGIHGGPGVPHGYILPLKLLARHSSINVVLYDQCGCGQSSRERAQNPQTENPWLLTIEYYVEELQHIITSFSSLGYCRFGYYLFGSSWGTVICQEFAVLQPKNLTGIILDGAFCDSQVYIKTQWRDRISTLPTYTQELLKKLEANRDHKSPLYAELNKVLGSHFTSRQVPRPDCFSSALSSMNSVIYECMQGPSEFTVGGVLEQWSITERLHRVQVPVLVVLGEYDTMTEECGSLILSHVPFGWPLVVIPRAAHCKLMDEPALCIEKFANFIATTENSRARALEMHNNNT